MIYVLKILQLKEKQRKKQAKKWSRKNKRQHPLLHWIRNNPHLSIKVQLYRPRERRLLALAKVPRLLMIGYRNLLARDYLLNVQQNNHPSKDAKKASFYRMRKFPFKSQDVPLSSTHLVKTSDDAHKAALVSDSKAVPEVIPVPTYNSVPATDQVYDETLKDHPSCWKHEGGATLKAQVSSSATKPASELQMSCSISPATVSFSKSETDLSSFMCPRGWMPVSVTAGPRVSTSCHRSLESAKNAAPIIDPKALVFDEIPFARPLSDMPEFLDRSASNPIPAAPSEAFCYLSLPSVMECSKRVVSYKFSQSIYM
nr:PREDICTED: uncharacterized protein LOC102364706 [Latimeria chalumnae]|eukprot:XP_005993587.1 PREDICTED: uncharacterized protein LOC102364706 [Latimeria chalumnae]